MIRSVAKRLYYGALRVASYLRPRRVVVCYAWPDFKKKAEGLADLLRQHGLPARVVFANSFGEYSKIKVGRDVYVGYWNAYPAAFLPKEYVFINSEPLAIAKWENDPDWFPMMARSVEIWGYTEATGTAVAHLGRPFHYVPFGYAPDYERTFREHVGAIEPEEDWDVLFFGEVTPRRKLVLDQLSALGAKLLVICRDNPRYGADLDKAIARAQVVVTIFSYDDASTHIADYARLDMLLSNARFIVHEQLAPGNADPEFERAVVTASYEDLAVRCMQFVGTPVERRALAVKAQQWFKTERALKNYIPFATVERLLRA